jgi:hypothetical protein
MSASLAACIINLPWLQIPEVLRQMFQKGKHYI